MAGTTATSGAESAPNRLVSRLAAVALPALLALAPFEPRASIVRGLGVEVTLLELVAVVAALLLLLAGRRRLAELARRPSLPIVALLAYAAAHALSAALARDHGALAARFALRMAGVAVVGVAVAVAPAAVRRAGLRALAIAAVLVAGLALAEGGGLAALDPFLDLFRESWVVVGAERRATAGSTHPNLAGAMLAYGLVAGTALLAPRPRGLRACLPFAAFLAVGLLFTYSRGAAVAAAAGLLALAGAGTGPGRRVPLAALGALAAVGAVGYTDPTIRLRSQDDGTRSWFAGRITPADARLLLRPGESREAEALVKNTGRMPWKAGRGFMPAYTLHDRATGARAGEGFGPWLEEDVPPGAARRLKVRVRAPDRPGRFWLGWDMLHEHAGWFREHGSPPAWVPLDVTPDGSPAPGAADPPMMARPAQAEPPSRRELWRAALLLWRERPLTGVGPDNFRRLYGRVLNLPNADPRTHSNNTLLEAGATTGVLGALALLAALGGALWSAARGRTPEAAAVCGLATVLLVHGLADYVLAFTGHALVMAFVVGSASAPQRSTKRAVASG